MHNIIKQNNSISEQLQKLKVSAVSLIQTWLNNYEMIYQLKTLEGKTGVNADDKKKIWIATEEQVNSDFKERLRNILNPSSIPCPVERPQQFRNYILANLERLGKTEKQKLKELRRELTTLISESPIVARPLFGSVPTDEAFRLMRQDATTRVALQEFPVNFDRQQLATGNTESQDIWIPMTERWQADGAKHNFVVDANGYDELDRLAATFLLSFPVGKVKLTIIDLDYNRELAALKNRLNSVFVDNYILDEGALGNYLNARNQLLQKTFAEFGDAVEYNIQAGKIVVPYELCVINSLPTPMRHDTEANLGQLIRQGHRAGIYFVMFNTPQQQIFISEEDFIHLAHSDAPSPLFNTEQRHKLLAMLNEEVSSEAQRQQQAATTKRQQDKQAQLKQPFDDATKAFSVAMGYDSHEQETCFTLDSPHALVLGKTGSGKSNFLHLLLTGGMLKYSPDTLHFYLMDMKPGGVELADYRNMPHVSTLVADPGDPPINVEFLQSIREQIDIRARKMQKAGVRDLQGYNMRNTDKKLPRIVMLIDEFQSLFDRKKYTDLSMMLEVESLLSDILAKGRSYGIHAILSTQTLMGTQIPESVAKIEKQYFLKSDTFDMGDIRMFVRDVPEKELEGMKSHEAFSVDNSTHKNQYFMPELLLDEESHSLHDRLNAIKDKCKKYQSTGAKNVYYSVTQLECPELAAGLGEAYYSDYPEVSLGRSIEINSCNVSVRLENAKGQNLLITGINERGRFCTEEGGKWQGLRILLTSMISLLHYSKSQHVDARFILLQNSPDLKPGTKGHNYIQELMEAGDIEIYRGSEEQLSAVEDLLERVKNGQEGQLTFVFVEGQDYYRLDRELRVSDDTNKEEAKLFSFGSKPFGGTGGQKQTVRDAWLKILEDGPLYGIHTVWQVQNFERFLTDAPSSRRFFQNIAFLYNNTLRPISFKMTEDIDFKRLDASSERLRMCLFDGIDVNVIAPYQIPYEDEIEETINQKAI